MTDTVSSQKIRAAQAFVGPQVVAATLAVPNAIAIQQRFGDDGFTHLLVLQLCNVGQLLALAWVVGAAVWWAGRLPHWSRLRVLLLLTALALLVGALELPDSFSSFADRQAASVNPQLVTSVLVVLGCLSVPLAAAVGLWLARPGWRWAALGLAALACAPNNFVLDSDYLGLHLFVTLSAFALGCAALHNVDWAGAIAAAQRHTRATAERLLQVASGGVALVAVAWPSNSVVQQLASIEGAPLAPTITRLHAQLRQESAHDVTLQELPDGTRRWFEEMEGRPAVAPSSPTLLPKEPIVLLLTLDSVRADLFKPGKWLKERKFFSRFQESSVHFALARAPGSGTVPTLTSLFSGKYYSSLFWESPKAGLDVWPAKDLSPRFPELLQQHGVRTVTVASKSWLLNKQRVVAGFSEEYDLDKKAVKRSDHVKSDAMLQQLRTLLEQPTPGRTFIYAHFMDPHTPYDSGKVKSGPRKKMYISEIERVDEELAEFDAWLHSKGLNGRVVWVITADHGEAFGEHGGTFHAKNVYEEVIRVPLWIKVPEVKPQTVKTPVSLIDLGPTLLDLFEVPTPGHFMGQSLVPYLRGKKPKLSRPIAAETRLKQTIIFPDGVKAIRDQRNGSREVYDLKKDPKEKRNLVDSAAGWYQDALDLFFDTHRHPSYKKKAPYRP